MHMSTISPQLRISIIVDVRCYAPSNLRVFTTSFASCCQDVLCLALIDSSSGAVMPLSLSLLLLHDTDVEVLLRDQVLEQGSPAHAAAVAAAMQRVTAFHGEVPARGTYGQDRLQALHHYLHGLGPSHTGVVLLATTYLSNTEVFQTLSGLSTRPLPYTLCCVLCDAEATCCTSAELGPYVRLQRCSPDPYDVREAVQKSLLPFLQLSVRVGVRLQVGGVRLYGVAERTYVAELRRCCLPENFPAAHAHMPTLVFQGRSTCTCGTELRRHERGIAELQLEAILCPADVDESYLYGDSWVVQPAEAEADAGARFGAFFTQFAADAMLFSSTSAALLSPHQLALPRVCYLCYFLDRSSLLCRQVIPVEMRRVRGLAGLRGTVDHTFREELKKAHSEVSARTVKVADLVKGDVAQVAAQLRGGAPHNLSMQ